MKLKPTFDVIYEGVNITLDLQPYLKGLSYENSIESESAELKLDLIDPDRIWQNEWSPTKGDQISVRFGYEGEALFDAGSFEVDEIDFSRPPDRLAIRALATPFSKALREKRDAEYENVTLEAIAQQVASRHGLTVVGEIPSVTFKRQTQSDEDDLSFLRGLCDRFDLLVKVENGQLVFYSYSQLDREDAAYTLTNEDIKSISLTDSLDQVYRSVEISYTNPEDEELVEAQSENAVQDEGVERRADVLKVSLRVEDKDQAQLIADGKLRQANADKLTGNINLCTGDVRVDAGVNFTLDLGNAWSGKYQFKSITHTLSPDRGFDSSGSIRRVF